MSEISERYGRRADAFAAKVKAVPADAWQRQSPCPEWKTRDVLDHVIESTLYFLQSVDIKNVDRPSTQDDPAGAWKAIQTTVEAALEDPSKAGRMLDGPMGNSSFEDRVDRYLSFDLVIHAWDISRAAGIDETLDANAVQETRIQAEQLVELGRQMGAFGPAIDITDNATEQEQLLALVGRKVS